MTGFRDITSLLICILTGGWTAVAAVQPLSFGTTGNQEQIDSICKKEENTDSILHTSSTMLEEFTIDGMRRRNLINYQGSAIELKSTMMSEIPTLLGGGDVLSAIRSAAPVATASDLTASFNVRGLPTGSSLYSSNGVKMCNPLHLLGLYSVYAPGLYDSYILDTFPDVCLPYNTSAATMGALTDEVPQTTVEGNAHIGLIESHANIKVPLSQKHPTSMNIAIRQSYIDKVYPGLLKAGSSELGYSFTDGGFAISSQLSSEDLLSVNFTGSRDQIVMNNERVGKKNVNAGWSNFTGGAKLTHSRLSCGVGITYFSNSFEVEEGQHTIALPSSLTEVTAYGDLGLDKGWRLHIDGHMRSVSGQYNKAAATPYSGMIPGKSTAWEVNASSAWNKKISEILDLDFGLRLSGYSCSSNGDSYTRIVPQPRVAIGLKILRGIKLSARYARLVKFDRLVEESTTGMPVNFFINSDRKVEYEDNHSFELSINGRIPHTIIDWEVTGYFIKMINAAEYSGGLPNFISPEYDPLSDLHSGNGYSTGLSASLMRQWGNVRIRVRYGFGKSRVRIPYFSSDYLPSSHDRTHDLSAGLTWQFFRNFTLSGIFTYATGTPYTKAKYGYILGENLICEYYPHNGSRLPAYKRLDLSLSYQLKRKKLSHVFNVSVYNALASHNTLFIYSSYSLTDGIFEKESVMSGVIPSIAYTLHY